MTIENNQLGRYHILHLLGSGGMGEVYLAEDPRIKQQVAIKVIRIEQSPYPNAPNAQTALRLFQREARAIVSLDHPRILPLNDYGEQLQGKTSLVYLVMPYRPEGSLVDWVHQHYSDHLAPPDVIAHLVSQAAEALQHAHDHQITHADVKPANFLIRSNPKAPTYPDLLLSDFGIAHLESATTSTSQAIRGTPTYMAPEQYEGVRVPASDQYALAVMTYELLIGRPPFEGNAMRLMHQHANTPPEPPSAHNAGLSGAVDEVLLTALSKRPEERFRSVTAFATAFHQAIQQVEVANAPTRISAAPLPNITGALPETILINATLADAPTRITAPRDEATLLQPGPITPAPSSSLEPDRPTPIPQGWGNAPTGPTALPWPETISLGASNGSAPTEEAARLSGSGPIAPSTPIPSGPAIPGRRAGKRRWLFIAAAALVLLAMVMAGAIYAFPGILSGSAGAASSATVALTPASEHLRNTFALSGVTGTPDAAKQQVQAWVLSTTTPANSTTVAATGQVTTQATQATGSLLITNYSYSTITYYAGTSYPNTNGSGPPVSITIDATVTLDYNSPAVVAAHVDQAGSIGNFDANPNNFVYYNGPGPCPFTPPCDYIQNYSAFSGGQDAQTYTSVQQSDIDNAAQSLESANQPNATQVLQGQIQPNEQWVSIPQCTPNVSSDYNAGDQATQVTVTVTFTCSGEVYDHAGALTMATSLLTQQAATDPGDGYALVGQINTTVTNATVGAQNTVALMVSAEGVWVYQVSADQKQAFARLIAGKSIHEAQLLLSNQTGVGKVTIQLSGGNGQMLPTDPAKITIVVQAVSGL